MFKLIRSIFYSPEELLQMMSRSSVEASIAEGERIIIDEDGNAMVNFANEEVQRDFERHVNALKRAT